MLVKEKQTLETGRGTEKNNIQELLFKNTGQ